MRSAKRFVEFCALAVHAGSIAISADFTVFAAHVEANLRFRVCFSQFLHEENEVAADQRPARWECFWSVGKRDEAVFFPAAGLMHAADCPLFGSIDPTAYTPSAREGDYDA